MKISGEEFRDALIQIDDDLLPLERLRTVRYLIPPPAVMGMLGSRDPATLNDVERFMRRLNDIPRLRERIDTMIFRLQYQQDVDDNIHVSILKCRE
jgi:hypothetical protein